MHELLLVFFTVLAQASAGLLILSVLHQLLGGHQVHSATLFKVGIAALVIVGVAGCSAILHLGRPFRAMNALFGVGRSPMSNEIFSCAVYGGLLFVSLAVTYLRPAMEKAQLLLRVLTAVAAVVLLILIPAVYTIETIPQWSTSYTLWQMVLAGFTAGGALTLIWLPSRVSMVITVVATLLSGMMLPGYMAHLSATAPDMLQHGMGFFNAKMALYVIALVLSVVGFVKQKTSLASIAAVAFILAELAGRIAFYDLWSIGM